MDHGTFSTSEVDPYSVDGAFLAALRQSLMDMVGAMVQPESLSTTTSVTFRPDRHSDIERKDPTGVILTDGSVPRPDVVEITVGGQIRGSHEYEDHLHVSLRLRTRGGDHVYAKGPVREARLAFDAMRAAMASRRMSKAEARTAAAKPGAWRETAEMVARIVLGFVGFASYILGLFAAHGRLATAMVLGGLAVVAGSFASLILIPRARERRRRLNDVPEPVKAVNVIRLDRVDFSDLPLLEQFRTIPLDLT